jgi:LysM repeat protein/ABC-type branched-subunit amino acid transport system substrate-binding protein
MKLNCFIIIEKSRLWKFTILLLLSFLNTFSFAQPENNPIEEVEGKKYYVHFVQGGNTLYGLSKLFNVTPESIVSSNPGTINGLQIGQKLLIPLDKQAIEDQKVEVKQPETHTVQKSETLYGISKKYNITLDEIVKINPGVENGISIGQVLKLPITAKYSETEEKVIKTQVTFSDSVILYTVLPHETMYSISKRFMVPIEEIKLANNLTNEKLRKGDIIKIPSKKEKITKVEIRKVQEIKTKEIDTNIVFKAKNEYKIVYFLPFNLDGNGDQLRTITTEFLMGAQIALDSLEKMGLNAKVQIIDVSNDTIKFKQILGSKELNDVDLIIGPFTGKNLEIAALWAKKNQVRMISPLFPSTNVLKDNLYVYNAINSDITLIEGLATYIAKNKIGEQIILVRPDAKDDDLYQAFRSKFNKLNKGSIKITECLHTDVQNFIKKSGNTILIIPSRDKTFATRFVNNLSKNTAKNSNITIYATKEWVNNDDIRGFYKNKFNIHFASPNDFNYTYPETKKLLKKYRQKYNADLTKYSTQGFDVTLYFLQDFFLNKPNSTGVMNQINMKSIQLGSGYENKVCFILKQENYELIKLDIITE